MRALNLVYALRGKGRLPEGSKVAVVGGGVAGMTAAAAAARVGCEVTLLEKEEALLPLLRGNMTRWLHPHIYDWPQDGAEQSEAGLPLLTWHAEPARDVVVQLERQWDALPEQSRIRTHLNVESVDVPSEGQGPRHLVTWNSPGLNEGQFDAVFLTVGFGFERKVEGIQWSSYWREDPLHQISLGGSERYLISGCGDGGLIDLLRVSLRDFRHEDVLREFLSDPSLGDLKSKLLEIEEQAKNPRNEANEYLAEQYRSLTVPESLDRAIKARLRKSTSVVLNGLKPRPLTLQSSILNRLLVSRLLYHFKILPYRPGEFDVVKKGEQYEVTFKTGKPELFNHIVCRHGPHPGALKQEFQDIWKKSADLRAMSRLDLTRSPLWPPGFFDGKSGRTTGLPSSISEQPTPDSSGETVRASAGDVKSGQPELSPARETESGSSRVEEVNARTVSEAVIPGVQEKTPDSPQRQVVEPSPSERVVRASTKTGRPLDAAGILVVLFLVWFFFLKDGQRQSPQGNVVRTPTNLVSPESSRSAIVRPGEMNGDARPVPNATKAVSKMAPGGGRSKNPEASTAGGTAFASDRIGTVQQLRESHRVRQLSSGDGDQRTLDHVPAGVFGFISPHPTFLYGQSKVNREQDAQGRGVEVHKLADGQMHLVGYVWDVEARAVATGRPVSVSLSSRPFGRSQSLVSIPFGRIRSGRIQDEQGQLLMALELGASSEM
ncbi:hypothetical protein D187_010160 [Cystobacter fuscus DSM 2262]|uniref:FAD/NAD(P)-binding domain-containing protein n=1 Tax=Cystobacter fuscus (strain ATCC 25194 / DSM 2262 / NBRC 100088 / M29) TaxID=1242864 RepID=S9PET1_CYSF2|nr:hypothetical protein D187_010160 [Cystobacter fuscus DSM 2262]